MSNARCKRNIGSPEVQALIATPDGAMRILYLLLHKNHPGLKPKDVEELYDQCVEEHGPEYLDSKLADCSGRFPKDESEEVKKALIEKGLLPTEEPFRRKDATA